MLLITSKHDEASTKDASSQTGHRIIHFKCKQCHGNRRKMTLQWLNIATLAAHRFIRWCGRKFEQKR